MGKMRVEELAKELGRSVQELTGELARHGFRIPSDGSIDAADWERMKARLSGADKKSQGTEGGANEAASPKNAEEAPRKKRLVAVFRPQNARSTVLNRRPPRPARPERPATGEAGSRPARRRAADPQGRPVRPHSALQNPVSVPDEAEAKAASPASETALRKDTELKVSGMKTNSAAAKEAELKTAALNETGSVTGAAKEAELKVNDAKTVNASELKAGGDSPKASTVNPAADNSANAEPSPEKKAGKETAESKTASASATAAQAKSVKAEDSSKKISDDINQSSDASKTKEAADKGEESGKSAADAHGAYGKADESKVQAENLSKDGRKDTANTKSEADGKSDLAISADSDRKNDTVRKADADKKQDADRRSDADKKQDADRRSDFDKKQDTDRRSDPDKKADTDRRSDSDKRASSDKKDSSQAGKGKDAQRQNSYDSRSSSQSDRRQNRSDKGSYAAKNDRSDRRSDQRSFRSGQGSQTGSSDRRQTGARPGQAAGSDRRPLSTDRQAGGSSDRRGGFDRSGSGADRFASSSDRRSASGQGRNDKSFGQNKSQGQAGKSKGGFGDGMGSKMADKNRNRNVRRTEKEKEKFDRYEQDGRTLAIRKKKDPNRAGAFHKPEPVAVKEEEKIRTIILPESLTLKELADKMKIQASQIIKKLFLEGRMVTVNQELSYEDAEAIALEYDILCEMEEKKDLIADLLQEEAEEEDVMVSRPPVVCVMGHVDHGKTSLLDAIRNTNVIDREAGGITQHIGASVINYNDRSITFLDTPGHEAFTAMRMRGANSTDIAVLVVAADDGVKPQTVEAINHAKAAGIEIIVAINKIDKPAANVERVKQELTEYELVSEDWGGSTIMVPVSAKTHEGIDDLLEMILLTSDVLELKSNPNRRARGLVIEAKLDKGRGPVATVLVQKGTLHVGDPICAGPCYGKIRAMTDDKGRRVKEAGPSMPVEVIGFSDVPGAGEIFTSPQTEKEAKNFAETFITVGREKMLEETRSRMSLDDLFSQIKEGTLKELNLIVKADVQGSVEAVKQSLLKLSNDEVVVKVLHGGVGAINESDVTLAGASGAIIIGFNVRPDAQAKSTAEHEGVDIRLYRVIYDAINDIENAMKGMLDPIYEEKVTGHLQVRQVFKASGIGSIAGSYVTDGVVVRGSKARISRDSKQIYDGQIASLKRFKDDVKEVKAGYECGLVFDGFNDIREDDQVEVYIMVEVPR